MRSLPRARPYHEQVPHTAGHCEMLQVWQGHLAKDHAFPCSHKTNTRSAVSVITRQDASIATREATMPSTQAAKRETPSGFPRDSIDEHNISPWKLWVNVWCGNAGM